MKKFDEVLPFIFLLLCSLLTAAHFLRAQQLIFVVIFLFLPVLFFIRKKVAFYIIQGALFFSIVEWILTSIRVINYRVANSISYSKFGIILSAVIILTAFTMYLIFKSKRY
jgi:hypothetical protein